MTYHLRCGSCDEYLVCENCGAPVEVDDPIPGQVGPRHSKVSFDPGRRNAWSTHRGLILLDLRKHQPSLAREVWTRLEIGSSNGLCTRMGELHALGLVERTGEERLTDTGTPADEWRLSDQGWAVTNGNGEPPKRKRVIPPPR